MRMIMMLAMTIKILSKLYVAPTRRCRSPVLIIIFIDVMPSPKKNEMIAIKAIIISIACRCVK